MSDSEDDIVLSRRIKSMYKISFFYCCYRSKSTAHRFQDATPDTNNFF